MRFPTKLLCTLMLITHASYPFLADIGKNTVEILAKEGITLKLDQKIVDELKFFNENIEKFSNNVKMTIDPQTFAELNKLRRSCAFTFIGLCFTTCGIKVLYDSCKDIQAKLNDKENKELAWYEILGWRDAVGPVIGIVDMGIGYKLISES